MRHSLFSREWVRHLEALWSRRDAGDPWPQEPAVRAIGEGILPRLREEGETWVESLEEFFPNFESIEAPGSTSDLPPSVDQVLHFHRFLEKVEGPEQDRIWREAIARLRAEGHPDLPPEGETYASFRARLDALGPHAAARICSIGHALTLLRNHERLGRATADRPVALVIGPAADHNGAFGADSGFPLLDALIQSERFHVLYFETNREEGAHESLRRVYEGTGRRIHTIVFAGHGTETALALGGVDPMQAFRMEPEEEFLQVEDLISGDLGDLNAMIEPEGQILMWSCSNGAGGEGAFNMANVVAEHAAGRRVYSTPIPSNLRRLIVREDLSLDLAWYETEGYVALHHEGDPGLLAPRPNRPQNTEVRRTRSSNPSRRG